MTWTNRNKIKLENCKSIKIEDSVFSQLKKLRQLEHPIEDIQKYKCKIRRSPNAYYKNTEHAKIVYDLKNVCIAYAKEHPMVNRTREQKAVYKVLRIKWHDKIKELRNN